MTTDRTDPSSEPPRDPRFDAAWRAASREEPPPALDAAILAAARRAVGTSPQPVAVPEATRPERWWWPLAAAASIGAVAIGVLQITGSDRTGGADSVRAVVTDMPAERPAAAVPTAPALVPEAVAPFVPAPAVKPESAATTPVASGNAGVRKESDAGSRNEARGAPARNTAPGAVSAGRAPDDLAAAQTQAPQRQARATSPAAEVGDAAKATAPVAASAPPAAQAPGQVAPPVAAGAAAPARDAQPFPAGAATPQRMDSESARPAALGKMMPAPATGARADERARERTPLPVAEWLALIRKLRAEGHTEQLNREAAAFRAAHPEAQQQLSDALSGSVAPPPAPTR